jgi:cyclic beta-1,2-glucan synthetase
VQRQIQYGGRRGVPWGISESAYYAQDLDGNYQYAPSACQGSGLKRGLGDDLGRRALIASFLAAPLDPRRCSRNADRLRREGLEGKYGFYEAIDYTGRSTAKRPRGGIPLPTYMAHHQGMTLVVDRQRAQRIADAEPLSL